jgi:hypothetical protein
MQIGNDKAAHNNKIQKCSGSRRSEADAIRQTGFEQELCRS